MTHTGGGGVDIVNKSVGKIRLSDPLNVESTPTFAVKTSQKQCLLALQDEKAQQTVLYSFMQARYVLFLK